MRAAGMDRLLARQLIADQMQAIWRPGEFTKVDSGRVDSGFCTARSWLPSFRAPDREKTALYSVARLQRKKAVHDQPAQGLVGTR